MDEKIFQEYKNRVRRELEEETDAGWIFWEQLRKPGRKSELERIPEPEKIGGDV